MRLSPPLLSLVLTFFAPVAAATAVGAQTADTTSAPAAAPTLAPTVPSNVVGPATPASTTASSPDPALQAAIMRSLEGMMVEQRHLSDETRSAMLGALTPAHRAYVASLVGALAIAATPDNVGTARQIDATLSPGERQGVLRADAERLTRERDLMRRLLSDMSARMTPDERAAMQKQMAKAQSDASRLTPQQREAMARQAQQFVAIASPGATVLGTPQTAGELLLHALTAHANIMGL